MKQSLKSNLNSNKRYIIRKYVLASSVTQAIKKEHLAPVSEVFIDDDWKNSTTHEIGFKV